MDRIYIVEGVPYQGQELVYALELFETENRLWYIDYFNPDSVETTFLKPNTLTIIIGITPKLKKDERAEKLNEMRAKFTDEFITPQNLFPNPKDPILIVDNQLIKVKAAKETLMIINPKDIRYIQYVNHTSFALYGQNAKNGAVTIWTKEQAR